MKLLIVDDSKTMRMLVRRALRLANIGEHVVEEAGDGAEALVKLRQAKFDAVLVDWNMPTMNGLEMLKIVKAENLAPHVGFITSEGTADIRDLAMANGAAFLVVKPFTPEAIREAIVPVLGAGRKAS